ncbi:amino acid--tRNA ligase-related protein, partial [Marinomonas arenicola]
MSDEQIMVITKEMMTSLFIVLMNIDLGAFPRMPYSEAMETYGSDKPDLRIPLTIVSVSDLMADVDFK